MRRKSCPGVETASENPQSVEVECLVPGIARRQLSLDCRLCRGGEWVGVRRCRKIGKVRRGQVN